MAAKNGETKSGKPIEWVGPLSDIPLGDVLKRIALEERSGDLQVISGRVIKTIYFDRGFIVFAASNLKRDRLGESMIELGRLSRREFAMATELMKKSRRRFGQALVHAGLMSEEELGRQVASQVNRIVLSLFKVEDGIYSFDERPTLIPVDLMVSLSIYRILLDGIRRMPNDDLVLRNLPSLRTRLRVSTRPPFTMSFRRLKPVEREVLRAAGKRASLGSILDAVAHDRSLTLRACYGLFAAGLLEVAKSGTTTRPLKVQEETGSFVLSEIQGKFAQVRATNVRQEILLEYDRLDRVPELDLLKLSQVAAQNEVQEAYEKQTHAWSKKKDLVRHEASMAAKVDEIQARLDKAYRQLLDTRVSMGSSTNPSFGQSVQRTKPARAALSAKGDASEKDVPITIPPLDEELVQEVSIVLAESEPSKPRSHSSPDTHPTTVKDDSRQALKTRFGPSAVPPRETRIQQLLRDANLHIQVRDWEGAISLLYELAELAPNNASYRGMLARAMARHPVMRRSAERHFINALRLEPQSADLHYSLGLYYDSFGLKARADTEFRTVLRINPSHEGARKRLLGDQRKKDPLREMFRKIFG